MQRSGTIIYALAFGLFFVMLMGCEGGKTSTFNSDTDTVAIVRMQQNSMMKAIGSEGDTIRVEISANLTVPALNRDDSVSVELCASLMQFLFESDSLCSCDSKHLAKELIINELNYLIPGVESYVLSDSVYADSIAPDVKYSYTVLPVYNDNGVISLCKSRIIQYACEKASEDNSFLNYDLLNNCIIENSTMFPIENYDGVLEILRRKLLNEKSADSEQQLIELGYFNLDNMRLTNNFFFTPTGVTWSYQPLEIGCFALGVTNIEIPYAELLPLMNHDAIMDFMLE